MACSSWWSGITASFTCSGCCSFADGIQYVTGCTLGKDNIEKAGWGKLAITLVDKKSERAVRVAYCTVPHCSGAIIPKWRRDWRARTGGVRQGQNGSSSGAMQHAALG